MARGAGPHRGSGGGLLPDAAAVSAEERAAFLALETAGPPGRGRLWASPGLQGPWWWPLALAVCAGLLVIVSLHSGAFFRRSGG